MRARSPTTVLYLSTHMGRESKNRFSESLLGFHHDMGVCKCSSDPITSLHRSSVVRTIYAADYRPYRVTLRRYVLTVYYVGRDCVREGLITLFCPCITAMNIAPEVEQNAAVCCAANVPPPCPVYWIGGCLLRQNFRAARDIDGGVCGDLLRGILCHSCLLCQMSRELSTGGVSAVTDMER